MVESCVTRSADRGWCFIENPGDAQIIVQLENGDREILKRSEFNLSPRRNLVEMGREFGLDLVVIDAQVYLFGGPRGSRDQRQ